MAPSIDETPSDGALEGGRTTGADACLQWG